MSQFTSANWPDPLSISSPSARPRAHVVIDCVGDICGIHVDLHNLPYERHLVGGRREGKSEKGGEVHREGMIKRSEIKEGGKREKGGRGGR